MTKIISVLFLLSGSLFFSNAAHAAVSPISVSIIPPAQFPPSDFSVAGLRLSLLWGHHRDLYGLDFGLLGNVTDQDFSGIGVSGGFNYTKGTTTAIGLQLAGIANINTNKTRIIGLQAALGFNSNTAESKVIGLQFALANHSPFTAVYGLQVGIYNKAREVTGFQIGLVNFTTDLRGIQIGLINFHEKGLFSVSPILNIGF